MTFVNLSLHHFKIASIHCERQNFHITNKKVKNLSQIEESTEVHDALLIFFTFRDEILCILHNGGKSVANMEG